MSMAVAQPYFVAPRAATPPPRWATPPRVLTPPPRLYTVLPPSPTAMTAANAAADISARTGGTTTVVTTRLLEPLASLEARLNARLLNQVEGAAMRIEARMDSAVKRVDQHLGEVGSLVHELRASRTQNSFSGPPSVGQSPASPAMSASRRVVSPSPKGSVVATPPYTSPLVAPYRVVTATPAQVAPAVAVVVGRSPVVLRPCAGSVAAACLAGTAVEAASTADPVAGVASSDAPVWRELAELRKQFQTLQASVDSDMLEAFRRLRRQTGDLSTKVDALMTNSGLAAGGSSSSHGAGAVAQRGRTISVDVLQPSSSKLPHSGEGHFVVDTIDGYQHPTVNDQQLFQVIDNRLAGLREEVIRALEERLTTATSDLAKLREEASEAAASAADSAARSAAAAAASAEAASVGQDVPRRHSRGSSGSPTHHLRHAGQVDRADLTSLQDQLLQLLGSTTGELRALSERAEQGMAVLDERSQACNTELEMLKSRMRIVEGALSGSEARMAAEAGDLRSEQLAMTDRLHNVEEGFSLLAQRVTSAAVSTAGEPRPRGLSSDEAALLGQMHAESAVLKARVSSTEDRLNSLAESLVSTLEEPPARPRPTPLQGNEASSQFHQSGDRTSPSGFSASTFSPGFDRLAELEADVVQLRQQAAQLRVMSTSNAAPGRSLAPVVVRRVRATSGTFGSPQGSNFGSPHGSNQITSPSGEVPSFRAEGGGGLAEVGQGTFLREVMEHGAGGPLAEAAVAAAASLTQGGGDGQRRFGREDRLSAPAALAKPQPSTAAATAVTSMLRQPQTSIKPQRSVDLSPPRLDAAALEELEVSRTASTASSPSRQHLMRGQGSGGGGRTGTGKSRTSSQELKERSTFTTFGALPPGHPARGGGSPGTPDLARAGESRSATPPRGGTLAGNKPPTPPQQFRTTGAQRAARQT